ncbi:MULTISPECIES: site-specific DNA-methyltransferase [unclassified Mesorhizobium]|uniref:site-specific DNA-methyltransferase n=1 Tax=unclassified Mesorhizobium TaxID=325217 RepID=UPI003336A671
MSKKTKLELTWIGKDERPKLEPRILIEDTSLSYHATARKSDADIFDNMLIHGDNLLALKALEADFAGKVKCVFIDPPYNTGSAFTHYDDGLEHSLWLSLMRDRLEMIRTLLSDDGSLWITIDDTEGHYLKVLADEIFGRTNFVATCVWEKDKGGRGDADISLSHDNILVFSRDRERWATARNLLPRTETQLGRFKNPDQDPRGPWRQGDDGTAKSGTEKQRFAVELPSGRKVTPPPGRYWAFAPETLETARNEGRAYFGTDGDRLPIIKRYLSEVRDGVAPRTWWTADEVGTNQGAKRDHLNKLLPGIEPFATPKPEGLLHRIIHIASNPGDLVLDSFGGSGTTGAVAHKMGRRWIMVELGDHAETHVVPRLKKVIDGDDAGGITETVGWEGGGGFRYYRLAPSLLVHDKYSNWVIAKDYNAAMLAEALCRHMNFTYAPSQNPDEYWNHGFSTETDFIYVTTQNLTHDACRKISEDVGPDRSLLICCKAFNANPDSFENLTLVKIPTAILSKCEWGRDDYSLNVQNLPLAPDEAEEPRISSGKRKKDLDLPLFNLSADEGEV